MDKERFFQFRTVFANAAKRLREAVTLPESDIVRDATIQRFEFTYELAWKALKLYLQHQGFETPGPRQTFKKAFVEGIIKAPGEADVWLKMLDDRNLTSHTYKEELAKTIYRHIVEQYVDLLENLSGRLSQVELD